MQQNTSFNFFGKIIKFSIIFFVFGFIFFGNANSAFADTHTWTGAAGTDWATAGNWDIGAPVANDDLVFPAGGANKAMTNTITATTVFYSIDFSGSGYSVTGNSITLYVTPTRSTSCSAVVSICDSSTSGGNSIALAISLGTAVKTINVLNAAETLSLITGAKSGTLGGITKNGGGVLFVSGTNTYTGAVLVSAGTFKNGSNTGTGTTAGGVTVASGATWDLNGTTVGTEGITSIIGTGVSNAGALTNSSASTATYSGAIVLGNPGATFNASNGPMALTGAITGTGRALTLDGTNTTTTNTFGRANMSTAGTLIKNGVGYWRSSSTSTSSYTGATSINAGTLAISAVTGLGTTAAGTTIASGATLDLRGIAVLAETLNINGTGAAGKNGALINSSGTAASISGAVTLAGSTTFYSDSGNLTVSGAVNLATFTLTLDGTNAASVLGTGVASAGAASAIVKNGTGSWTLSGANTYTGTVSVNVGTLKIGAAGGGTNTPLGTIGAGTTVASGAALDLGGFTFGTAETLNISGAGPAGTTGAIINSTGTGQWKGAITLAANATIDGDNAIVLAAGATVNLGAGYTLSLDGTSASNSIVTVISQASGSGVVTKVGTGTWTLSGVSTFTGDLNILAGTVIASTSAQSVGNGGNIDLGDTSGSNAASLLVNTALTITRPIILATNASVGTLTIGNTGSNINVIFSGGVTGTNNVTINSNAGTGTLTFQTNAIATTGTITHIGAGTGLLTISAAIGPNVTSVIQNSSNSQLTLSAANTLSGSVQVTAGTMTNTNTLSVGTTLSIANGAVFTQGSAALNVAGDMTVGGGTNGTFNGSGSALSLDGNLTLNSGAIWNKGAGVITFDSNGLSKVIIGNALNADLGSITIGDSSQSKVITLGSNITVTNIIVTTNAKLSQGASYDLTTTGTITVNANGTWENVGTGNVTLGGTVANAGTITLESSGRNSCGTAGADTIVLTSSDTTNRMWSGAGTFNLWDLTVSEMSHATAMLSSSSTDGGGGGTNVNWSFGGCVPSDAYWVGGDGNWSEAATHWATVSNGSPGAGNLPGATTNVYFDSSSGTGTVTINSASVTVADFDDSSANITVDTSSNGITITGDLTVAGTLSGATAVTLNGTSKNIYGSGTISAPVILSTTRTVDITGSNTLTMSGIIGDGGGAKGLSKTGTGTLALSGANTFTGGLTIKVGTVTGSTSANAFGANSSVITIGDSGGSADATLTGKDGLTFANPITIATGSSGTLNISNSANSAIFSGTLTLNNNLTLVGSDGYSLNIDGNITGTGNIVFNNVNSGITVLNGTSVNNIGTITNSGAGGGWGSSIYSVIGTNVTGVIQNSTTGSLSLYGANTFTSGLTIKAGEVAGNNSANAFGANSSVITIGDTSGTANATLQTNISGGPIPNPITIAAGSGGTLSIQDNNYGTFSGAITLDNNLTINEASSVFLNFTGGIMGTGNIIVNTTSTGSVTLSTNPINMTGTITNSGSGTGATTISSVVGTNVTGITQNSATSPLTLSGVNTYTGPITNSAGTLSLTQTTAYSTMTLAGDTTTVITNGKTITLNSLVSTATSGHLANIDSSTPSSPYTITDGNGGTNVNDYLSVTDSNASPASTFYYGANGDADAYSQANGWAATVSVGITISGTVYGIDETTPLSGTPAINMSIGGAASTTVNLSSGTFTFSGVTAPSPGTVITLWMDTANTDNATLVFKYGTVCEGGTTSCIGLKLFKNSVIIGVDYNNTANTITNSDLVDCDNDTGTGCADTDIGFTTGGTEDGLKGDYYDGINFDTFVSTHTDTTVNFNPADSLGINYANSSDGETFSVRWTGYVKADYTETYTFYATSDDGEKLWVNGTQLINAWIDRGPTENSGTIALTAGQWYPITYEFYENAYGAVTTLSYSSASVSKTIIPQTNLSTTGNIGGLSLTWSTNQLRIKDANAKYAPGGDVNIQKLSLSNGTYTGALETLTLSGSGASSTCTDATAMPLCIASGTFTPMSNTVVYSGGGSSATPIFSDGFETGDFTNWTSSANSGTGSVKEVIAGAAYAGSYGAHFANTSSTNGYGRATKLYTFPASNKIYAKGKFKPNTSIIGGNGMSSYIAFFKDNPTWQDIGGLYHGDAVGSTNWFLRVRNKDGTGSNAVSSVAPTIGSWNTVKLLLDQSGTDPVYTLWINGTQAATYTDTTSGTMYSPLELRIQTSEISWNHTADAYWDDVALYDTDPDAGGNVNITATTYNNLTIGGTSTYTLPASDITLRGDLVVTTGATVTKSTSNKIIFAKGGGGSQTLTGNATNSDLGIIQVSANSGNTTLNLGSDITFTSLTIDTDQIFTQGASYNLTTGEVTVDAGGTWTNTGTGDLTFTDSGISNGGTITFDSSGIGCGGTKAIVITGSASWSGAGEFNLTDVDLSNQNALVSITVYNGANTTGNTGSWTWSGCAGGTMIYRSVAPGATSALARGSIDIFNSLPPTGTTLDTGHEDATNLVHAWLFNAGTGTNVKDYVDNNNAVITNFTGQWADGGGWDNSGSDLNHIDPAAFTAVNAPWTVVIGVRMSNISRSNEGLMGVGNDSFYIDTSGYVADYDFVGSTNRFVNGVDTDGPIFIDTNYTLAYYVADTEQFTSSYILCNDGWSNGAYGKFAFIYAYQGTVDTALLQRLAANPYAMFGTGPGGAVTISGSTATFTNDLPTNIGVGDALQYDSDGNGSINAIAFISGRTDAKHFTVKTVSGGAPTAVTGDTDWSIFRAYTSLANAESGDENNSIADTVEDFDTWSGGKDIVTPGEIWNIALYANGTTADTHAYFEDWTTSSNNYMRVYTPTLTSEVGISQRHSGVWDDSKYHISDSEYAVFAISSTLNYFRVDGLQFHVDFQNNNRQVFSAFAYTGSDEIWVSNSIFKGTRQAGGYTYSAVSVGDGPAGGIVKVWNNIMYDAGTLGGGGTTGGLMWGPGTWSSYLYAYNNTIYGFTTGFDGGGGNGPIAKNNLVYNNTTDYYDSTGPNWDAASTNNLSKDGTAPGSNAKINKTLTFVDATGKDFHLAATDTDAIDQGIDLSPDFTTDIDGETRPTDAWDIGADEYFAPGVTMFGYGWRLDNDNEVDASYAIEENEPLLSGVYIGDKRRLRLGISNNGTSTTMNYTYRLEYSSNTCSSWTQVPAAGDDSGPWKMIASSNLTNSSNTTDSTGLTNPANKSFVTGKAMTTVSETPAITLISAQFTELEYSISPTNNVVTDLKYCFRATNAGVADNFTYSKQPEIKAFGMIFRSRGGGSGAEASSATPDPQVEDGDGGGDDGGNGEGDIIISAASGTAILTNDSVSSVSLVSGGSGYTTPPLVSFCGGGGTGAMGTAVLTSDVVTDVIINNGGNSYSSPPTVLFGGVCGGAGGGSGEGDSGFLYGKNNLASANASGFDFAVANLFKYLLYFLF